MCDNSDKSYALKEMAGDGVLKLWEPPFTGVDGDCVFLERDMGVVGWGFVVIATWFGLDRGVDVWDCVVITTRLKDTGDKDCVIRVIF